MDRASLKERESSWFHQQFLSDLQWLEVILEHTSICWAFLDSRFNYVAVNRAYVEVLGLGKTQLIGRNHFDLFPDGERQTIFEQVRATGKSFQYTAKPFLRGYQPGLGIIEADWSLTPIFDPDNRLAGFVFVSKLSQSPDAGNGPKLLRSFFEQAPWGMIALEISSGKVILRNPQSERWSQILLETGDLRQGTPDGELFFHSSSPLLRALQFGEARIEQWVPFHQANESGSGFAFRVDLIPIQNEVGKIVAGVALFSDPAAKEREDTYLTMVAQLNQIIDFLPDPTFAVDRRRKVVAWNYAMEKLTGVKKGDIVGQGDAAYTEIFFDCKKPGLIDYFWGESIDSATYKSLIIEKEYLSARFEWKTFQDDEKGRMLELRATPIYLEGNLVGAIQTLRDISLHTDLEQENLKVQKLESLGVLAGGIAHDFNNYLTAILSNIQLSQLKYKTNQQIDFYLTSIEKIVLEAAGLTKQLLCFSKGGAPVKKYTSLSQLVRETAEFVLRGSKSKCIYNISPDIWSVEADTGQISQVISNIIINADQAMEKGGIIDISLADKVVQMGEILSLKAGDYVKITIRDQGPGIPQQYLKKIFDPYFTTKAKGNGLGLATSFFIIANHHGYIDVETQVGRGTSFHIYLPASGHPHSEKVSVPASAVLRGKGRILLMDDEETLRKAAGAMLTEIGYEVELSHDGVETLARYMAAQERGTPFDIVILDLIIPGGLGAEEIIQELRRFDPDVKTVVSSGYSNNHPIMDNYLRYGFTGVVPKPYQLSQLHQIIQKILKNGADQF